MDYPDHLVLEASSSRLPAGFVRQVLALYRSEAVWGSLRHEAALRLREKKTHPPLPCRVTLAQALPKGKIIESIIQKATELGVAEIVPLLTERVATRLDDDAAEGKGNKWQQVAIEAIKQCGQPWLPKVAAPPSK